MEDNASGDENFIISPKLPGNDIGLGTQTIGKKKVPMWRLFLLSEMIFAVNMGYGVESAYAVPLVVAAGLDISYASLTLTISPFIGIFFQFFLGSFSDRCTCCWGRRRPFILLLALSMIVGFILSPFSPRLSQLHINGAKMTGILLTTLGVLILDLSLGQIQLPIRAYLLDVLPVSQTEKGNFILIIVAGVGGFCGYALGGIDWAKLFNQEQNIVSESQVFFSLAVVITVICLVCTLFSVKEKVEWQPEENKKASCCSIFCATTSKGCYRELYDTIKDTLEFIFYLSRDMWILWLMVLFGFISNFSLSLFFTTFVGEVVYGGDSSAPQDSELYHLYSKGIRTGSWGLAISLGVMTASFIFMDWVVKCFGLKPVVVTVQYLCVISLFGMTVLTSVPSVLILVSFSGPYLGIILTVPFILLSVYKVRHLIM